MLASGGLWERNQSRRFDSFPSRQEFHDFRPKLPDLLRWCSINACHCAASTPSASRTRIEAWQVAFHLSGFLSRSTVYVGMSNKILMAWLFDMLCLTDRTFHPQTESGKRRKDALLDGSPVTPLPTPKLSPQPQSSRPARFDRASMSNNAPCREVARRIEPAELKSVASSKELRSRRISRDLRKSRPKRGQ